MKILIITILLALTSVTGIAQLDPNRLITTDETQGNVIYGVLPDRMGNIWLASQSGLMRYDGYELKRFNPDLNDSTTVGNILTYNIFEDKSGNIWIGCMDYISRYDPAKKSFVNYQFSNITGYPIYAQPFVWSTVSDNRGRIYFGIASFLGFDGKYPLIYYDQHEDKMKLIEFPDSLQIKNIYSLAVDRNDNIWIKSSDNFLMIDTLHQVHMIGYPEEVRLDSNNWMSAIHYDPSGKILLSSGHYRLYAYDPESKTFSSWSMANVSQGKDDRITVYNFADDTDGNLWMASDRGLIFFDRKNNRFESFVNNESLQQMEIYNLHFDSFGDLWLATNRGLMRYTGRTLLKSVVHNINNDKSLTQGWVNKFFGDGNGMVWIYTRGDILHSGINLFNPVTGKLTPYIFQSFLPGMDSYDVLAITAPGEFFIRTNKGIFRCNIFTKECSPAGLPAALDSTYIFSAIRDSRSNWVFGTTDGLFIKSKDGKLDHIKLSGLPGNNLSSDEITIVEESKHKGLWMLTNSGLFLYDYDSKKINRIGLNREHGKLYSQDINSLYEDDDGTVWIGTWQGGLSRYNPETEEIKTYTTSDGLPSNSIQGILGDEQNRVLWLSTFNGISRFVINDEKFNNFSLNDGIQGLLYSDGAYLKTSDGFFFFGGNNGFTYFSADDVNRKSVPPLVYIRDFKVADQSMEQKELTQYGSISASGAVFRLAYAQNNISVDYTAIHYANPSQNEFAYKLENYDKDWRYVKNIRTAYYYNLPPGQYKFRVKAANSNGIWNETGASVSFRVLPPWWRTWWAYVMYGILFIAVVFAIDRIQRRRLLEKERRIAREKELKQAREIEKAYEELKATQVQLIHSEKMASLGELTAGIAHEIQNPLNFVNNFSEVNLELIGELNGEVDKGNLDEVRAIATDLSQNEEKINYHGKRADAIVKGMLKHSRSSNGEKIPTDINTLADEYLRLSYHGLRAKDKSFNAEFRLDADESLPKIYTVQQDIGRVLLNLINNAFYAVNAKTRERHVEEYKPIVIIGTKNLGNHIEISVKDNGDGIPSSVKDKIFQPFFTTKPAGEGTGLGLSLSYDIITKGHNGQLTVETMEGEGTEFKILIPIQV